MHPQQPYYGPPSGQAPNPQNYDFIMGPGQQPKRKLPVGSSSMLMRILTVVIGVTVLAVIAIAIKSLFSGGGNTLPLTSVIQDQAELTHLATTATNNPVTKTLLSADSQNFALTVELVISTEQTQLITYLANSGHKLTPAEVAAKQSAILDKELTSAAAANNYDHAFVQATQSQLTTYKNDLTAAYKVTPGTQGQALLRADYKNAQLLYTELTSPAS